MRKSRSTRRALENSNNSRQQKSRSASSKPKSVNVKNTENRSENRIYIVLSRTSTFVAKGIRLFTREPYSHTSISFDGDLETMYSFARRGIYNPLNAGFIEEKLDSGIFGREKKTGCAVYCLELEEDDYRVVRAIVDYMAERKEEFSYNFPGMFTSAINRPVNPDKSFFCSQFLAWLLDSVNVNLVDKNYALVKPGDLYRALEDYMIYEGELQRYVKYYNSHPYIEQRSKLDVKPYKGNKNGKIVIYDDVRKNILAHIKEKSAEQI